MDFFSIAFVFGIFWSLGNRLRRCFCLEAGQPLEFCLEIGLGIFLLNTAWMGLGLVGLWWEPLWLTGFLCLAALFLADLIQVLKKNRAWQIKGGASSWAALGLILIYFIPLLLLSLIPETFYDSLNYFLGMPVFWISRHGITDYPTHLLSGYFHGGSLFFMNGIVLAGAEGAKVLNVGILGLILFFTSGWVGEFAGPKAGIWAAAAVGTFPLLFLNFWAARVDGLLSLILLLFFYSLDRMDGKKEKSWMAAAGLFAGLALSIKPTAVIGIGAGLLAILWCRGFPSFFKRGWVVPAFLAVMEVGPWLVKNFCFTGNPFFPYALSWFHGRSYSAMGQARLLGENHQFLPMNHGLFSVLTLPWRLTFPQAGDGQFIGPLVLAFLPALFFFKINHPSLKFLQRTMLLAFVFGLCLSHMLRFSMSAFILALIVFSAALVGERDKKWGFLWVGALCLSAFLCLGAYLELGKRFYDPVNFWLGRETRESYLNRMMLNSYEPLVEWAEAHLPSNSRYLIVGDSRGVYYPGTAFASSAFDDPFFAKAAKEEKDSAGILRRLREMGIDYLVVNAPEGLRVSKDYHQYELSPQEWKSFNDFEKRGLETVYWKNFQAIYRVREKLQAPKINGMNLFSFFAPQAYDFFQDFGAGRFLEAGRDLDALLSLFPGEKFWLEKKARLAEAEKKNRVSTR